MTDNVLIVIQPISTYSIWELKFHIIGSIEMHMVYCFSVRKEFSTFIWCQSCRSCDSERNKICYKALIKYYHETFNVLYYIQFTVERSVSVFCYITIRKSRPICLILLINRKHRIILIKFPDTSLGVGAAPGRNSGCSLVKMM